MNNILYIRSDEHEQFEIGLYINADIILKKYNCPIGTMSEKLLPAIENFIKVNNLNLTQIKCIVAFLGPGSYTSLRIGTTCANILAYALNIPIYGISKNELFDIKLIKKIKKQKSFSKPVNPYYQQAI